MCYLPRLNRLPNVNSAANFLDLSTITGLRASACGEISPSQVLDTTPSSAYQTKAEGSEGKASKESDNPLLLGLQGRHK